MDALSTRKITTHFRFSTPTGPEAIKFLKREELGRRVWGLLIDLSERMPHQF